MSAPAQGAAVVATRPDDALSFHRWHQKSVHNAYDHMDSLGDQLRVHGFRSVEIDIHEGKLGASGLKGDWWVYHVALPGFDDSSCATLSACLEQIDAFHREVPDHDVLTVFIDVKDELLQAGHRPGDLDARVRASLPAGALFEPRHMLGRCPAASSLRDAVAGACSWPTLGELRGRVLVQWLDALEAGVNILATDRIDAERDPWTDTLAPPPRPARNVAGR